MKELVLFIIFIVIATYLYTVYRLSNSTVKTSFLMIAVIILIPFWGCVIYLLYERLNSSDRKSLKL